ncbi:tyrosine-type recombinase/integrase [Candidatus Eisenbacteria bacterium]|uniref:Tyrosine-type recombinase/integrase n=1 Tax=Eiseniibacteriota bacterium TaxID=2212470 RepID=A0ABV6YJB1_UNCEI
MPSRPKGLFRQKGRQSWAWRRKKNGVEFFRGLGCDIREARKQAKELNRNFDYGALLPTSVTVHDAADEWIKLYVNVHRKNLKDRRLVTRRVEMYLNPFMGHMLLERVGKNDLRKYRMWLEKHERDLSPQSVANVLTEARCFFNWCVDSDYIPRAPVPRRLLPGVQQKPPDRLTDDEVEQILQSLDGHLLWVVQLGLETGMRWGELTRLQADDLDRQARCIRVHGTKSYRTRQVPFSMLSDEVRERLLSSVGKVIRYAENSNSFVNSAVKRRSGIGRFHMHQLRHTFACRYVEDRGRLEILQRLLGHSTVAQTQRYAMPSDEAVRKEAIERRSVAMGVATG